MANHTRDSWIDAAYTRFNASGLASVRVESIARDILATKGSFYWHFENRGDLVEAVIRRWEREETDALIELAEGSSGSARERLEILFELVGTRMAERGGERTLYAEAEAEGVLEIVSRVIQRRMDYVTGLLAELGFVDADVRAAVAISAAIGLQQLVTGGWEPMTQDEIVRTMLRQALTP